jgi:hypothetical protein
MRLHQKDGLFHDPGDWQPAKLLCWGAAQDEGGLTVEQYHRAAVQAKLSGHLEQIPEMPDQEQLDFLTYGHTVQTPAIVVWLPIGYFGKPCLMVTTLYYASTLHSPSAWQRDSSASVQGDSNESEEGTDDETSEAGDADEVSEESIPPLPQQPIRAARTILQSIQNTLQKTDDEMEEVDIVHILGAIIASDSPELKLQDVTTRL